MLVLRARYWVYVNHVHNDYLETVLETGLPGLLILVLFILWWVRRSVRIWRSPVTPAHSTRRSRC